MDKHEASAASAAGPTPANQATAPHLPETSMLDLPPSYTEAMNHPVVGPGNPPSVIPSAPPLEASTTSPYPHNPYNAQGQPGQQYPSYPNEQTDGQFSAWDDRATRILMMQRLEMEERFRQARSQQEQEILWNLILTDLYMSGYHDFLLIDLMRFWEFQFHIYKSIIDGLSSGSQNDTSWPYFESMDNVFKGSTDAFSPTVTSGSSILDPNTEMVLIPHAPVQPLSSPTTTSMQPVTDGSITAANVSNTNSTLESTTTIGGGDNPTLTTLPIAQTNQNFNENIPMLPPTDGVGEGSAISSPADNAVSGLTDIGSIQVTLPSESTGTSFVNDVTSASVITAQPDLLSKVLAGDGDVVTTQPLATGLPSIVQPLEPIDDNHDGCCEGDGCCGDDGCCGNGGCDEDCNDGCDGCDACDGCDCDW